uniref:Uncharacterized protein n=1 Tax=Astatotilapia calliptera TaxID=8154 RepID=A0AAX7VUQ5_ASTCA
CICTPSHSRLLTRVRTWVHYTHSPLGPSQRTVTGNYLKRKTKSSNEVSTVSHYCGEMLRIFLNVFPLGVMEFGGLVSPYNDQGRADVYQGCADCLTVVYSGVFQGIPGRLLLIYRKEGKHTDTDELKAGESIHRKLAECLKFNVETTFIYDGKAGERENLEIS